MVADEKGGWDVLFLGDSLFEPWRGTKMDQPWTAYDDIPETWNQSFGKTFGEKAHVLAISGASDLPLHALLALAQLGSLALLLCHACSALIFCKSCLGLLPCLRLHCLQVVNGDFEYFLQPGGSSRIFRSARGFLLEAFVGAGRVSCSPPPSTNLRVLSRTGPSGTLRA